MKWSFLVTALATTGGPPRQGGFAEFCEGCCFVEELRRRRPSLEEFYSFQGTHWSGHTVTVLASSDDQRGAINYIAQAEQGSTMVHDVANLMYMYMWKNMLEA